MEEDIKKEDFNELWEINPQYSDPDNSYEKTYSLVNNIVKHKFYSIDNKLVDLKFLISRYKRYVQTKNIINEGTDPKYIKKENKIQPIFRYVFDNMYNSIEKPPETSKHYYFWGFLTEEEIKERYQLFLERCQK